MHHLEGARQRQWPARRLRLGQELPQVGLRRRREAVPPGGRGEEGGEQGQPGCGGGAAGHGEVVHDEGQRGHRADRRCEPPAHRQHPRDPDADEATVIDRVSILSPPFAAA